MGRGSIAAVLVALALPATASADLAINFDSPTIANECTTVTNQFTGVTLGGLYPTFLRNTGVNHSGGQSLQTGGGIGCGEPDAQPHPVMTLSSTYASASIWVRQEGGSGSIGYQLQAFDTAGTRIDTNGSSFTALPAPTTTYTQLTAADNDNTNRIARLELVPSNTGPTLVNIRYDDLTLTSGAGGGTPDFSLGPAPPIRVAQGGNAGIDIPVNRFNGSANAITNITVTPQPADFRYADAYKPFGEDVVHLSVGPNGSATPGTRTLTVTATPDSAATGPGPRSIDVPVTVVPTPTTIAIANPAAGTMLARVPYDLTVSGSFTTPRPGDAHLCGVVTQSATPPAIPSPCADTTVAAGHDWSLTVDHGFAPGQNYVHVFVVDAGGVSAVATRAFQIASEATGVDLRVTGLEVTQGSQRYTSAGGMAIPRAAGMNTVAYGGVQLVTRKPLWVRVFADTNRAATSDGTTPGVTARLRVTRNGVEIPGSPFLPQNGPQDLAVGGNYATDADRRDISHGYFFEIPADEARGPLVLDATVNDDTRPIIECATCRADDEMRLTGVTFRPMKTLHIYPLRFHDDYHPETAPMCDPPRDTVQCPRVPQKDVVAEFQRAREVYPFPIALHTWVADVNITADQMAAEAADAQWHRDHPDDDANLRAGIQPPRNDEFILHEAGDYERDYQPPGSVIGVGRGSYPGVTSAPTVFCCSPLRIEQYAIVEELRPLTSVAHEYGHVIGLRHADRGPDAPMGATDPHGPAYGCGGGTHGQVADPDWPDLRGTLAGFAFDPERHIVLPAYGTDGRAANYDFMSYCAENGSDSNSWLAARNWDQLVNDQNDGPATRAVRAAPGPPGPALAVTLRLGLDGGDGVVTSIEPSEAPSQASDPNGSYELVVVGADGGTLSTTRVTPSVTHVDGGGGQAELSLAATIPAGANPQAVQLRKDGQVVAERRASAHAPTVRLLAPKPGTRVGRRGVLTVRWRAADADHDTLRYAVEEATSPRGPFRMVAAGGTAQLAKVRAALLRPSRNARIRVRVNDGFHVASATSGPVRIAPRPPEVTIFAPAAGTKVRADAVLALEGQAVDAANAMVADRSLVWRDGRHVLGKGSQVSVTGLRAGRRTITLSAKGGGVTGVARVRIRVTPVVPRLLTLAVPAKLSAGARTVALKLAASVPARLTVKGGRSVKRAALSRRTRTVVVRIKPGAGTLRLRLLLRGGGRSATVPLTIARG